MGQLFEIAKEVSLDPLRGVILLLVVLLGVTLWAYWQERRRSNRIQDERISEAREDTELMTNALNEATNAVNEFQGSNEALRLAFETFVRAQH